MHNKKKWMEINECINKHAWMNKQNNKPALRKIAFWLKYNTHKNKNLKVIKMFLFIHWLWLLYWLDLGEYSDESTALKGAENLLRMTGAPK